jgi:ACGX-repeat protein
MKRSDFAFAHSAQGVMKNTEAPAACGAACGTADKPAEEKPAACGSACGTGDKEEKPQEEKPAACGSACGAGEK